MTTSRSTPRLRFTALALACVILLVAVSDRRHAHGLAGLGLQLAGFACLACAALLRIWSSVFIAGFKDRVLVMDGPYAALRHPLYAGSLLAMLGVGLATGSLVITLVLVVVFAIVYARAASSEDRLLRAAHGEAFERYANTVRAFRPDWSALRVPELLQIHPRVLWKAFVDAGALFGFYLLLRVADGLQQLGITPTWLTLP